MAKVLWKPGNMLYPLPAVMVSCADKNGNANIITVAWTGTICSDPPMLYISVRKSRYSHHMLSETGEFYVNLTTQDLVRETDWCGVRSGRDFNKFTEMGLTPRMGCLEKVPMIGESPVNIACKVVQVEELGSHDMFIANVVGVYVDDRYMNDKGAFDLSLAKPLVYSHGQYYAAGSHLGSFGYSVQKNAPEKKKEEGRSASAGTSENAGRHKQAGKKNAAGRHSGSFGSSDRKKYEKKEAAGRRFGDSGNTDRKKYEKKEGTGRHFGSFINTDRKKKEDTGRNSGSSWNSSQKNKPKKK